MGCIYGNEQEESLGSMDILPLTEPTSLSKFVEVLLSHGVLTTKEKETKKLIL